MPWPRRSWRRWHRRFGRALGHRHSARKPTLQAGGPVFLPCDAAGWSEERRRIVLLHELAHVRRGNAATQLLARLSLIVNWWNPLAWAAWREFLTERERATDDMVLDAGARASDYASHLLEVARAMQATPRLGWAAVAMARRSHWRGGWLPFWIPA